MYFVDNNGEFKVGDISLDTGFFITVDDYGLELPEINTVSPIFEPLNVSLKNIISWLERGILVNFSSYNEALKVLLFVSEYNRFAKSENDNANRNIYPLVYVAESRLKEMLDYEDKKEEEESKQKNPFIRKTKKISEYSRRKENSVKNVSWNKKDNIGINGEYKRDTMVKMFDMFDENTKLVNDEFLYTYEDVNLEN